MRPLSGRSKNKLLVKTCTWYDLHMVKNKRLVVLITAKQMKSLKDESRKHGASLGEIVRRALDRRKQ